MTRQIIAHRGYSAKYPENTMLAFKQAVHYGADAIELDVHMTLDQKLVICHDENIERTSNGYGEIPQLTLSQIQSFRFDNHMKVDHKVPHYDLTAPSLREFLEWMKGTSIWVNIEIKNNINEYVGIVGKIIDLVESFHLEDRVILSSFNHPTILEVKSHNPNIACGFLTECALINPGAYCHQNGIEYYHPIYSSITQDAISNCNQYGIGINTWTVNDVSSMEALRSLGVNRIITNYVEDAVAYYK